MHYGNKRTAIFSFAGLDSEKRVIYTCTHTSDQWEKGKKPQKVACAKCNTSIPLWMLELNPYVQ